MGQFSKLGLKKNVLELLDKTGFVESREVQDKIIPLVLDGKNVVFTSQTGSGKTLAFTVGFLNKINPKQGLQMIVLVPTRELCSQVAMEMKRFCAPANINIGILFGGREMHKDSTTLSKKNQIIVATPGRLIHHINDKNIEVGSVRQIVFDESDQMFDNGFYKDCAYLKTRASKEAQIVLASATVTDKVRDFVEDEIKDFEFLEIGMNIPAKIYQEKIFCPIKDKLELLKRIFIEKKIKKAIIFCNTKIKTELIAESLKDITKAQFINGDLDQQDRENYLKHFIQGKISVLVATDLAARGLHIEQIDTIINFDVPTREEFYIHRIGRTGRNNEKGYALTIICPEDEERYEKIEKIYDLVDKVKIIKL